MYSMVTLVNNTVLWTDQSQALKLKLWLKIFQQTKAQDQMASQVNSIKRLAKS